VSLRIRNWDDNFENSASRKLKRLEWVSVPIKTDGEGYTALVDHPNAAAHLGAWYAIVEAAAKQTPKENRGRLPGGIPQTFGGICQSLSRMSRLPSTIFREVLPRLMEIGWIEECEPFHSLTDIVAESAREVAESASTSAESGVTGKGREGKGITPPTPAPFGADSEVSDVCSSTASQGLVRHDVSTEKKDEGKPNGVGKVDALLDGKPVQHRRKGKRTSEEIRRSLGTRLPWWEEFWKVYPNHDAMNPAMDAFERTIHDHDTATLLWKGAKAYSMKFARDPDMKLAHGATWINQERWLDDTAPKPISQADETPTFYKGEFMSHAEYAARKAAGQ
jgi:hypothetical protein